MSKNNHSFKNNKGNVWMTENPCKEISLSEKLYSRCYPVLTGKFIPQIEEVIFNPPFTIINWTDKTKTVIKCSENDVYDEEKAFGYAIAKKVFGSTSEVNRIIANASRPQNKIKKAKKLPVKEVSE